jgi:hypothetical protein
VAGVQHPWQVTGHEPPQPLGPPHGLGQLGVQTHWYAAEHEPASQAPHSSVPPSQPLGGAPHWAGSDAHVAGVHVAAHW